MAPYALWAVSSVALGVLLVSRAPQYSIFGSYPWTAASFFLLQWLSYSFYNVVLYPKFFSPLRHLPQPPGATFFNGHFAYISKETGGIPQRKWLREIPNDGLIRYTHLFNAERLLITNAKALAEVLVQRNYDFIKPSQIRFGLGRLLGIGVLLAEGDEHKIQRKNLMPAFSFRHIKDLYPIFWSKSVEMIQALQQTLKKTPDNNVLEIGGWVSRATLDIIGVAGMGQDFHAIQDPDTELNRTYRKVFAPTPAAQLLGFLAFFIHPYILGKLPLKRNDDIQEAAAVIRKTCRQLIDKKKQKLQEKDSTADVDIISVALESGGFTDEELVDQMMTFLAAGHETTATSTLWAVYLLCKHPEVQNRLREEVREKLPSISSNPSAVVTASILDALPYLHAVCNEVLRVYSPVPITLREAAKDTSILGQFVPKGTKVILAPWAVNYSPELWGPDADNFKPERWMGAGKTNNGGAESNYAFLTFLHGPRSCIGQSFAKAEFACLLAALVGTFEMELQDPDMEIVIKGAITAKPKDGIPVKMKSVDGW